MKTDVNALINQIKTKLLNYCPSENSAEQESWWMLEELINKNKAHILQEKTISLSQDQQNKLDTWITQRTKEHKPLQYILGHVPFCNIDITVRPPILIPRPETEYWASWTIEKLKPVKNETLQILDMGTGSGCIALALANALQRAHVTGIDINPEAIKLAQENQTKNNITNATFVRSDFEGTVETLKDKRFDLIVSNPPYISAQEYKTLDDTVKRWEDEKALLAEKSGFEAFEKIIITSRKLLIQNETFARLNIPQIILEIGMNQETHVEKLLSENGFKNIAIFKDLRGINRWLTAGL